MAPPNQVSYRSAELFKIAQAMRGDLRILERAVASLEDGPKADGKVGGWDVAKQLGVKVDAAHRNMVGTLRIYCQAYTRTADKLEQVASNYKAAEEAAEDTARRAGNLALRPQTPLNTELSAPSSAQKWY